MHSSVGRTSGTTYEGHGPGTIRGVAMRLGMAALLWVGASSDRAAADEADRLRIVGSFAKVSLRADETEFGLDAKIDTGADSTSIDAREIEEFSRDGEEWVRFQVPLGEDDERVEIETRVVDTVTIIGAGDEESERLVVDMDLCIGDLLLETEVNLSDREGLDYRLLIGREYLVRGGFLINPAQSDAVQPTCDDSETD